MTKESLQKPTEILQTAAAVAATTTAHGGNLSLQQQNEQALLLEPFYERLIGMHFDQSSIAIERCRDLCAEFGFTVKQEASTHRNIYVYCSREGLPDSLRNPKSTPQRKRPSKRCDCRWRVVLYENEQSKWEFRKSLNPDAGKHNHELMRPEEIERSWPKEVTDLICELARLRMITQDIRGRVQDQFPHIHWNERRFYNRLSEERQKIKLRDSIERTHQLSDLWSKVCMATAGNDDLFQFVKQELAMLFQSICETVQIDPHTFPVPYIFKDDNENDETSESSTTDNNTYNAHETSGIRRSSSRSSATLNTLAVAKSNNSLKGYISVEIPKQIYYIKIHNQRQLHETQLLKTQHRTRTFSEDHSVGEPLRKQAKKGKGRQFALNDDHRLPSESPMQHDSLPLMGHSSSYSTNSHRNSASTSSRDQQQLQQPATAFVYSYETLDTSLTSYVTPSFQTNYTLSANSPSTPGFNTPGMSFTFDPQQHSPIGRNSAESNKNNSNSNSNSNSSCNEPTIHSVLHSNPMSSHHHHHQQQQQQQHRGGCGTPPNAQRQSPSQQSSSNQSNNNGNNQTLYSLSLSDDKSQNTGAPSMLSRSTLPSVEQQPYHQHQQQHHHNHNHHLMQHHHPSTLPPPPSPSPQHLHGSSNSMLSIYQQQQQQHHHHQQSEPRNSH